MQSPDNPTATLNEHSRDVLERLEHLADCTVHTSDGSEFRLHKALLAEQSVVLGCAKLTRIRSISYVRLKRKLKKITFDKELEGFR